jgi:hypothetical protein
VIHQLACVQSALLLHSTQNRTAAPAIYRANLKLKTKHSLTVRYKRLGIFSIDYKQILIEAADFQLISRLAQSNTGYLIMLLQVQGCKLSNAKWRSWVTFAPYTFASTRRPALCV